MASGCLTSPTTACGQFGHCANGTELLPQWKEPFICVCDFPYTNTGDLSVEPTRACEINTYGIQAVWAVCATGWFVVFVFALVTAYRLSLAAPDSMKRRSESMLLSMKAVHAALFMVVAFLEISLPEERVVGKDLATTVVYSVASTLFWIEYKLFLLIPTLSSVTAIARVIAPRPMALYTKATPFLMILTFVADFIVLGMVSTFNTAQNEMYAIIHIEMSAVGSCLLLGSSVLAMTAILNKFKDMLSSSAQQQQQQQQEQGQQQAQGNNTGSNQRSKLGNVEEKIRHLRYETLFLLMFFPVGLVVFGAVATLRDWSVYLLALVWAATAIVTLRFVYMSHETVQIHLKRSKTEGASHFGGQLVPYSDGDDNNGKNTQNESDYAAFSSSLDNAKNAISSIAKRRKKRKPKFVNAMTRVTEERTAAISSRMEGDSFTFMNSNDTSNQLSM